MTVAPIQWPVQALSLLPDALRPGTLLALITVLCWAVLNGGLKTAWAALCRGAAFVVEAAIAILLLPEYAVTTMRRRNGVGPSSTVLAVGDLADRIADQAEALRDGNPRRPIPWRHAPWKTCAAVVVACAAAWVVMDRAPRSSAVVHELSQAFERWREVEAWAGVPDGRRAERGAGLRTPLPELTGMRRSGRAVRVGLACQRIDPCRGRVIVRSGGGRLLRVQSTTVAADSDTVVVVRRVPRGATIRIRR